MKHDGKSASRWRLAPVLTLAVGATVVVVCAMAIGLNGARSDNPIPADKQAFQDREAASHEAAVALASEHPELIPTRNPGLVVPTWTPAAWDYGIVQTGQSRF